MTEQNIKKSDILNLADDVYENTELISNAVKHLSAKKHLNPDNQKFVNNFLNDMQKLQQTSVKLRHIATKQPDYDGWLIPPKETK